MLQKTFLTGKADYLESSIARMTSCLSAQGFEMLFSAQRHPAPHIHSIHVKDSLCPALFANGKGINAQASQASALGEFIERLGNYYLFADYYLGQTPSGFLMHPQEQRVARQVFDKQRVLSDHLWSFYDPQGEVEASHLVALQDGAEVITSIPMQSLTTQETVFFPINLLNSLYASNGLAAGNTVAEAAIQAMSEIFERWSRAQIILNGWCLPRFDDAVWSGMPTITEAAQALASHGIRLDIRDASLGGQCPVVAIILHDEIDGRCFVSFGAHPICEVAIERTLTESLQGRDLTSRDGFEYPSIDSDFVTSEENREAHFIDASGRWHLSFFGDEANFEAVNWSFEGDIEAQWQQMQAWVKAQHKEVYMLSHAALDVPVVRLVVPGMSEIYPVTDLLDGNANRGLVLLEALNAVNWQKDTTIEALLALLEAEGYPAHTRVASLIGLLADPGIPWASLTVAELKMGCLLYLGDYEAALQALAEVFLLGQSQSEYYALEMMLGLLLDDGLEAQAPALMRLFGEERWVELVRWCDGECFLWNLELVNSHAFSARHQALLSAHQRMNLAMAQI
jgi:ribosomal protein S12 methylthiotransferase accessory factor